MACPAVTSPLFDPTKITEFLATVPGGPAQIRPERLPLQVLDSQKADPAWLAEVAIFKGALQKHSELRSLVALLQTKKISSVLEIGTARGGTFWLLCQLANANAQLISVDLPGGAFGGGYTADEAFWYQHYGHAAQQLVFIQKDSHVLTTIEEVRSLLAGRNIDLLFIDGDHRYEGVKADFNSYAPFVAKGGMVVFHDIIDHQAMPDCQVARFWQEVRVKYPAQEFIDPLDNRGWGPWGGIGVLTLQDGWQQHPCGEAPTGELAGNKAQA